MKSVIESLSHEGRGITHINGKTVFVDGALPSETVELSITKKRGKYNEAQVVEVFSASVDRTQPLCAHHGVCGGCSLQHLQAEAQIKFKEKTFLELLKHIANIQPETILPPLLGPIWGYRHKARLGVRHVRKKGKVLVGFREKNGRYLADINRCLILHPSIGEKIIALSELIANLEACDFIAQLEIAVGKQGPAIIIRNLQSLNPTDLEKIQLFAQQNQFYIFLQPAGPDSITLFYPNNPEPYLSYELEKQKLELWFHPADFTQVNPVINQQMVNRAVELLAPKKTDRVLDLFCGLGNFTLALAQQANNVVGIEGEKAMVQRCLMNAERNQLPHVQAFTANLADPSIWGDWAKQTYDKILLDPPRCGALEVVQMIRQFKAKEILYISCNPATFARDAAELIKQGYRLNKAGIMDMFPHTSHVEVMGFFTWSN
jgi:23S rRNA (uracil1939-C5)-methyltransferase